MTVGLQYKMLTPPKYFQSQRTSFEDYFSCRPTIYQTIAVALHQFLHKNNLWWHACNPKHTHNLNIIVERATISNDGATIMKLLDIVHPAAKTLVDIAKSQDAEVWCYN